MIRLSLTLFLTWIILTLPANGQSADAIIESMQHRFLQTPQQAAQMTVNTTNARGDKTDKKFEIYLSAQQDRGKIALKRDPHKEGLLLTISAGEFVKALYWNPSLPGSVNRISLQNQDKLFSGTAYSYEDIKQLILTREDTSRFVYTRKKTTDSTWVIQAEPQRNGVSQYSHRELTIRQDDYALMKISGFSGDKLLRSVRFYDFRISENGTPQPQKITGQFYRSGRVIITSEVALDYAVSFPEIDVFERSFIKGQ